MRCLTTTGYEGKTKAPVGSALLLTHRASRWLAFESRLWPSVEDQILKQSTYTPTPHVFCCFVLPHFWLLRFNVFLAHVKLLSCGSIHFSVWVFIPWISSDIIHWLLCTLDPLVGGLEHRFYFPIQLGMSSFQLTFIFFRGVGLNHAPDS